MCSAWLTALGLVLQAWLSDGIWGANAESERAKFLPGLPGSRDRNSTGDDQRPDPAP